MGFFVILLGSDEEGGREERNRKGIFSLDGFMFWDCF